MNNHLPDNSCADDDDVEIFPNLVAHPRALSIQGGFGWSNGSPNPANRTVAAADRLAAFLKKE